MLVTHDRSRHARLNAKNTRLVTQHLQTGGIGHLVK